MAFAPKLKWGNWVTTSQKTNKLAMVLAIPTNPNFKNLCKKGYVLIHNLTALICFTIQK